MLYEHWGDNRSGKSAINAFLAWLAYLAGQTVYCNCPRNPFTGEYVHILNFPHKHLDPSEVFQIELLDCYIMTDQGETAGLDSSNPISMKELQEAYWFGLQATKMGVDWHYDTVRHKSIVNRLRLNVHFYVQTVRYPPDPRLPLKAIHVRIKNRYSPVAKSFWIIKPQKLFPLFNSEVLIRPPQKRELPTVESIHKMLVGP